jgi:uncharacterized protein YecE (DUF72 family)
VIRVGPAGWSYADWEGRVYPASKPEGFHALSFLSRFFDCIEINSSFYAMPRAEHAAHWVSLVASRPEFRFHVKLNREFTHAAARETWPDLADEYRSGIEPLIRSRKLGAVLAQFPASFSLGDEEVRRLGRIRSLFPEAPLVLEVRHASWFTPPGLDTIRGLSYSLAYVDLPPAWNHPPDWHPPTGPVGYLRLHGRNTEQWFRREAERDDKYDYLYGEAELEGLAAKARRIAGVHGETSVVTNNHFAGKAVANALELRAMLSGEPVAAPSEVVETFPRLRARVRIEGQQSFF